MSGQFCNLTRLLHSAAVDPLVVDRVAAVVDDDMLVPGAIAVSDDELSGGRPSVMACSCLDRGVRVITLVLGEPTHLLPLWGTLTVLHDELWMWNVWFWCCLAVFSPLRSVIAGQRKHRSKCNGCQALLCCRLDNVTVGSFVHATLGCAEA